MSDSPVLDMHKHKLADGLPVSEADAVKMFSELFWHPIDRCPIDEVPIDALRYRILRQVPNHARSSVRIDNLVKTTIWRLWDKGLVDRQGRVLQKGRDFLISAHPEQSPLWLAVRDIWSNRLALVITVVGLLSGLLAIAQWLGWLPQRLGP